jgi:hypothetical protein
MAEHTVTLFKLISEPLRSEIHLEIYSAVLMAHPFFCCYRDANLAGIRKVCHTCVSIVSLSVGDVLFSELEVPTQPRMFFMKSGLTKYRQEASTEPVNVQRPQWLCEPVLWTTWTHCGTLQAVTESTLMAVDAKQFQSVCSSAVDTHLTRYAEVFVTLLNQLGEGCLTDIGESEQVNDASTYAFPELFVDSDEEEWHESKTSPRGSLGTNRSSGSHRGSHRRSALRFRGRASWTDKSSRWCRSLSKLCRPTIDRTSHVDDQTLYPDNVEPFSVSPIAEA